MSTTPTVLGNVPLEYTDANGKQVSIPLSALFFDPKHNNQLSVDPSKWPDPKTAPVTLPGFVASLLANLAQQQLIVPASVPSPKPALVITATDPGSTGNGIKITITSTPNIDPTKTTFSFKVEESDTYTGLTLGTIATVLGTDKAPGTTPGLVHVVGSVNSGSGVPAAVSKQTFNLPPPPPPPPLPGPSAQSVVSNAAKTATVFTLEAKKPGPDGALTTVTIANVGTTTFDLTAYWTKSATGVTLATLLTSLASLGFDIVGSAPSSGIFSVPAAGVVQLSGGTDGTSATAASAIVFAGQ